MESSLLPPPSSLPTTHQGQVVLAIEASEERVAEARQLTGHVHQLTPQLTTLPETVVGLGGGWWVVGGRVVIV